MDGDLSGPVIAEHDGWTLSSSSQNNPTKEGLESILAGTPPPAPDSLEAKAAADAAAAAVVAAAAAAATDAEEAEGETPAVEVPAAAAAPVVPKKANRVDLQRTRIDQLTLKAGESERLLAEERTKRETIERELTELRAKGSTTPADPATPATPAVAAPAAKPKPVWTGPDGYEAQGKSWEEYQSDRDEWSIETHRAETARITAEALAEYRKKDEDERKKDQESAANRAVMTAHGTRLDAARAVHPDFDAVVEKNLTSVKSPFINHLILHTNDGAELMYHLAHHPDEAAIIADLQPTRAMVDAIRYASAPIKLLSYFAGHPDEFQTLAMNKDPVATIVAIGRLDAKVSGAPAGTPPAVPVSAARPPVRPVTGAPQATPAALAATKDTTADFGPEWVAAENRKEAAALRASRGY